MGLRIVFMGTPDFAVASLQALYDAGYSIVAVVTQPDKPKGRGRKLSLSPVKEKALELELAVLQPEKIKNAEFTAQMEALKPDLIVVVAYGKILPKSILNMPPLGCVNVHASLLPKYRGAAPIQWAIMNGEKETGITTMLMDEGLDTGDMLLKERIEIDENMDFGTLHDALAQIGADLLSKTIDGLEKGSLKGQAQEGLEFSYAPLLERKHEWINWQDTAAAIANKIRGMHPWPGACTIYHNKPLKIRCAKVYDSKDNDAVPGTVISLQKGQGFVVQTGAGSLLVTQVQPFGKKNMSAVSFMNGYHLEVGYVFSTNEY